ncbi:hypothetical protein Pelo_1842 [Pelomyxa schiedti]|nr:hypothetical protein Pelo_1842 [Pelomyxa schiedti]
MEGKDHTLLLLEIRDPFCFPCLVPRLMNQFYDKPGGEFDTWLCSLLIGVHGQDATKKLALDDLISKLQIHISSILTNARIPPFTCRVLMRAASAGNVRFSAGNLQNAG